jgi:hypothetical protein
LLRAAIRYELAELTNLDPAGLIAARRARYRDFDGSAGRRAGRAADLVTAYFRRNS